MFKDKDAFRKHFETAKKEIFRLVHELTPEALRAIIKREEPETFKIGEDEIHENILKML